MYKLIVSVRRGSASAMPQAWARYPTIDLAKVGAADVLRDERVLRVMVVRNVIPPAFVEWVER